MAAGPAVATAKARIHFDRSPMAADIMWIKQAEGCFEGVARRSSGCAREGRIVNAE
jgi:hypothetical protein